MRKTFAFIGVFLSLVLLVACGTPPVAIPPEEFTGEFTAYCFEHVYFPDKNDHTADNEEEVLLDSLKELRAFRKKKSIDKKLAYASNNDELVDQLNTYSQEYFTENILIAILFETGSGSIRYEADSVSLDGKTVKVVLNCRVPSVGTADMCKWCILVECKRVEGITAAASQVVILKEWES